MPLWFACNLAGRDEKVDHEVIRQLLKAGSDASSRDVNNFTPLYSAARADSETAVSLLLSAGARSDAMNSLITCPLEGAIHGNHQGVVRLLLRDEDHAVGYKEVISASLLLAVDAGRPEVLDLLLRKILPYAGERSLEGHTQTRQFSWEPQIFVFHRAAALGNLAIIGVLLAAGMDEVMKNSSGDSAFDVAGGHAP